MIWIELTGPSGVGKSYWYEKLVRKYPEFDLKESLVQCISRHVLRNGGSGKKLRLLSFIASSRIMSKTGLSAIAHTRLLNYGMNTFGELCTGDTTDLENLVKIFLDHLDNSQDPMTRLTMINLYSRRLREFICCRSLAEEDQPVIFEDGIIHNNHGICDQNFLKIETVLPEKIIFLKADPGYIYRNRKRRISRGKGTFKEKHLTEKELLKETERVCVAYEKKIRNLRNRGVAVREIDVTEGEEKVLSTMYDTIVNRAVQVEGGLRLV